MEEETYWTHKPLGAFQLLDREQAVAAVLAGLFTLAVFWPYWI